jgi:hypothetical protein
MVDRATAAVLAAAAVLVVSVAGPAAAQEAADPKQWSEQFLSALMNRGIDATYTMLNEETVLGQTSKTAAPVLRDATSKHVQGKGTIINYELATDKKLGSRTAQITYIINHLRGSAQYRLTFYRTDRGWNLMGLQIEGEMMKFAFD